MSAQNKLQNLIDICQDARTFYSDASEKTSDPSMKRLFGQMIDVRNGVIIDLRAHMREKGMEIEQPSETFGGKVNKFVGETVADWSDNTDEALITYLEEAEDRCLHSFQDARKDDDLSADTQTLVARELDSLKRTHDYMKELKDAMARAA